MSSLTAKLFQKDGGADAGLDDIFKSSVCAFVHALFVADRIAQAGSSALTPRPSLPPTAIKRPGDSGKAATKPNKRARVLREDVDDVVPDKPQEPSDDVDPENSDGEPLVHESLSKKKKSKKKVKYVPAGETPEERDARTVFVGNLPPEMISNKVSLRMDSQESLSHSTSPPLKRWSSTSSRVLGCRTPLKPNPPGSGPYRSVNPQNR